MAKVARIPDCHPDRKHAGNGLCSPCAQRRDYYANLDKNRKRCRDIKRKERIENREKVYQRNRDFRKANPLSVLLARCKMGAKRRGIEFSLTREDLSIPEFCPLLGVRLDWSWGDGRTGLAPSIDRIDSSKGYVTGNVWVISDRANTIKNSATFEDFETMYLNWKKIR